MHTMLLLGAAIGIVALLVLAAGATIAIDRSRRAGRRMKRRRRAARHSANVRLWNQLFSRHNRPLLTDQRDVGRNR